MNIGEPLVRLVSPLESVARVRSIRLRLEPFGDDEATLQLHDRLGRTAATDRVAAGLTGLDIAGIRRQAGTTTARLLAVTPTLLAGVRALEAQLDTVLMALDCVPGHVRVVDGTSREPPAAGNAVIRASRTAVDLSRIRPFGLVDALEKGVTLIANNMSPRIGGALGQLTHDLMRSAACGVGVNLYLSEREAVGFGRHWDDHDVVIIQARGAKQWSIFEPLQLGPLKGYVQNEESGAQVFSTVLEPGDALYIPRGWSHEVRGFPGEVSAHYTISMRPPSAVDLLHLFSRISTVLDQENGSEEMPSPGYPHLDSRLLSRLMAEARANVLSEPILGPLRAADATNEQWRDWSFTAPLPGGLIFADIPDDPERIGLALAGHVLALHRAAVPVLARLAEGTATDLDELVESSTLGRPALISMIRTLASVDIVQLALPA